MSFRVNCPKCQTAYNCRDEQLGKKLQCPKCGQTFQAGHGSASPKPASPSPAPAKSVPAQAQPGPAVARRPAPSSPSVATRRSTSGPIIVGLAVALMAAIALGAAATYFLLRKEAPGPLAQVQSSSDSADTKEPAKPSADKLDEQPLVSSGPPPESQPETKSEPYPESLPGTKSEANSEAKPLAKEEPNVDAEPQSKDEPRVDSKPQPAKPEPLKDGSALPRKATVGVPFSYQLVLVGEREKGRCLKASGPKDLKVSADGLVEWTPEKGSQGTHEFTIMFNFSNVQRRYKIEVTAAGQRPSTTAKADAPLKNGDTLPKKAVVGQPFSYRLQPAGGTKRFSLISGPKGLQVSGDGVLAWTPEKGTFGKHDLSVQINSSELHRYTLVVEDALLERIVIRPLPPPAGWVMKPDGVTLIVSLAEQAQLVYIDTLAAKEIKRIDVDFKPADLALQGDTLFAVNKGASTIYNLDAKTGKVRKEYSVGSDAVGHIACHSKQGLVYATTTKFDVFSIDPATGRVANTGAKGFFVAVDPVAGKYVYTGLQPPLDGGELVFEDLPNGKFKVYWDEWGKRAVMMKYALDGSKLKQISGQNNAAVNGWVMHLTPDGKRIMILGGGGWRPKGEGAGGGYVVAVYNADNLESMVGQAPHGINIAFHPVLNLGVTNHAGTDLTFFNARSLASRGTLKFSQAGGGGPALLTFGAKGTKVILWNGEDRKNRQGLQFIPLDLKADERAELEKKYGKLPPARKN